MTNHTFGVGSVLGQIDCDDAFDAAVTDYLRRSDRTTTAGHPHIGIEFRAQPHDADPPGRLHIDMGRVKVFVDDGRAFVLVVDLAAGSFDLDTCHGVVHCADTRPDRAWEAVHRVIRPLLGLGLARHGLHALHAGAVGLDGAAALLIGPSGSGKSTATLRLTQAGARFIADDTCYVDSTLQVHGLADRSRVDPGGPVEVSGIDEPDGKIATRTGRFDPGPTPVGAIVALREPTGALDASSIMNSLLRTGTFGIDPPSDAQRLPTLSRLAETAPGAAVGPRPNSLSLDALRSMLQRPGGGAQ